MAPLQGRDTTTNDDAYTMGTRVWLHGLVGDQADLNGQRATVLLGQADDEDTRYFLETDDGKRVQAMRRNVRRTAQTSAGGDSSSRDEGGAISWHTSWQAGSTASLDTDFPCHIPPGLPERPRPVTWSEGASTSPMHSLPEAEQAARPVSVRKAVESVKRASQSPPGFVRVGDLLTDSLRRLPLAHDASREPESSRRSSTRLSIPEAEQTNGTPKMLLETVGITWQHVQSLNHDMGKLGVAPVLDINTEVISSTRGFASRSTCGIMLSGNRIDNLVIGGPAFNSGKLAKNDEIIRVDGAVCSTHEQMLELLSGNDEPNTPVTLTILRQGNGAVDNVTLTRMANEEIADKRALFELFTKLKDSAERLGGSDCGDLCDRVILLWSKMVLADAVHDESIVENVKSLQAGLKTLAEEQRFHIERIHTLNLNLAHRLSVSEALIIEMVLDLDMGDIDDLVQFGQQVMHDMALAVTGVQGNLHVLGLSKSSNVIHVGLVPGADSKERSAVTIARELRLQAETIDSPLRHGMITQKLSSLTVTEVSEQELHARRTAQLEEQVQDSGRREEEAGKKIAALRQLLGDDDCACMCVCVRARAGACVCGWLCPNHKKCRHLSPC